MSKLAYFTKKTAAVSYWASHKDEYLFQMDKEGSKGSKQFIVGSLDNIWELLKSGKNYIYESWEDNPIHFSLDIDVPKEDGVTYDDVYMNVQQIITGVLLAVNNSDISSLNLNDIVVLENENQSKEKVSKYSFHVIFRGLVMENYIAAAKFFDNLEGINLVGCDKSIYRKTCLRTCFSKKITKNQTLVPIVMEIGKKKTDNENNYSSLKEFWKSTLICNVKDHDVVYEAEEKEEVLEDSPKESKEGTPVDIAHLDHILMQLPNKYYDEYFYWSKIGMILRNSIGDQNQLFELFHKFSMQSKSKYKDKSDALKHWKSFKDNRKNKISIGTLYMWCKQEKISFTTQKTMDNIVSEYPERKLIISQSYKEINSRYVPIKEMKKFLEGKLCGIQSEKGTGKTTSLFKYLFEEGNLSLEDSVLFISSRRTFGIKLLGDIKKFGFKLYSEVKESYIDHDKMICQIDSLLRLSHDKFKYIIIDECESLMRYMTSSHFTKNMKAQSIVSSFECKIQEAEKVIFMDADLSDRSINYFKTLMNVESKDINIILNKFQPYNEYTISHMGMATWLKVLMDKIEANKKIVIPMASNNQAKDLKRLIESRCPDIKTLLIHSETSDADKMDQVLNVNQKWSSYNVVIYTPSVCMGISFDEEYFDHIFAYGCENSLGSQEFCQMLHRVRSPKEKTIYLALDRYCEYEADRHNLSIEKVSELVCYDYFLTFFNIQNNLIQKKHVPNTKPDAISKLLEGSGGSIIILEEEVEDTKTEYILQKKFVYPYKDEPIYNVYIMNTQELIGDRLNFANQLFGYFKMKGYKIEKHEWEDGEIIKNEIKEIRELRKEEEMSKEIDGIYNAPDITEDEFKELMGKRPEDMTQEELSKIKKRNFKRCYVLDTVNKEILTNYKEVSTMRHYHNLSVILPNNEKTIDERLDDIRMDRVNNQYLMNAYSDLTTKNAYTKHQWAIKFIKLLGFSLTEIGSKLPTITLEDKMNEEFMNELEKNKEYFVVKYGISFPKKNIKDMKLAEKLKFISKILESQYGIEITKDSAKNYYLTDHNKWDQLYEFRTKQSPINIKLTDKIVKKETSSVNIDQSWFEE